MPHKLSLSFTPTPMHPLSRMSDELGIDLWIKRDDLTGDIATGGNKIRKLEYILADAIDRGADTVLTTGGPQSNHCKATAALAAQAGLNAVLVFAGREPEKKQANLFLDERVGAEIRFSGAYTPEQMEAALFSTYDELKQDGRKPYLIPIGGSNPLGTRGYIDAYEELGEHDFDWIVVTAGSGGTYAGLYIAKHRARHRTKLLGISPWLKREDITSRVRDCIKGLEPQWHIDDVMIDDAYLGRGYGKLTTEAQQAIDRMAQSEAIILDHVYTGKAMAGLIDYVHRGLIKPKDKVLFWHTGGAAGLLAAADKWT
ncbi:1-aminocyclopropane-1-carboxylate deaminase/D-cysteine desulfhydrase [Caldalkalibacillus salinus]|uniref:1-aminocyclopropane-1-carboxylate deaminase/D-cysteine desulfhydrase n=1 Tax=Caldalkalibacillus salinus TaxID=2803787 RepID=UPI0019250B52|nr:D-cysteine desulfhydrase family protein [Caldalkalibacillus salinus]